MAAADGSFRIDKFAFGDDEINYSLYDKTAASALQDVQILQSPILEAFTDNSISLRSRLVTYSRQDLLYLPVILLNELSENTRTTTGLGGGGTFGAGSFVVVINSATKDLSTFSGQPGVIDGRRTATGAASNFIRLDQGINNSASIPSEALDPNLVESAYIVEIDNRLGEIVTTTSLSSVATPSFIDDDQIASYSFGSDPYVMPIGPADSSTGEDTSDSGTPLKGQRGTRLSYSIRASQHLVTNDYLFDTFGSTATVDTFSLKFIDTFIRVHGETTGYRVDVPIRFVKQA
jgi:hypothetical protein